MARRYSDAMRTAIAMTWEQYEALGPEGRGEYINGAFIPMNQPRKVQQRIAQRLIALIQAAVAPGHEALGSWGWKPADDEFGPDVILVPDSEEDLRFTGMPLLVVEIVSSDRNADLVVKSGKYQALGLPRFWVVDPDAGPELIAYELGPSGTWDEVARASGEQRATFDTGAGTVDIVPADLARPPLQ